MATDSETLAAYEAARDDVLVNGFSIGADGREWKRDNLEILEKMIAYYRDRVARVSNGSIFDRSMIGVPRRGDA